MESRLLFMKTHSEEARAKRRVYENRRYRENVDFRNYKNGKSRFRQELGLYYIDTIKTERGCRRCGEKNPWCLDLHHIDPADKTTEVSKLKGTNQTQIDAEIEKCEVLCANCHRIEHRIDACS